MSTRRRGLAAIFGSRESHPQPVPSPPASPRPGRLPDVPVAEDRVMTSEELQQSVEALETVLRTMDQVRDQTNRYNAALREHARSLRGYAVGINMITARDDKGQRVNVGEDKVSENLLVHCANYYDRLAEAQETLARQYLEEYNILNNVAAKYFKTLARDSAKLDITLKELTKKLSKLTHKSAPPGSANTQNASTVQNPGIHEIYVQRLTGLSGQIQSVRKDHLATYTRVQKGVDRTVARTFGRCSRSSYSSLSDALVKTGGAEGMGGVNVWGVYANARISPPINELGGEEGDVDQEDEWEPSIEEGEDPEMSPRQVAQQQGPRPPTSMSDYSFIPRSQNQAYSSTLRVQGKLPSQASFNPYSGNQQMSTSRLSTSQAAGSQQLPGSQQVPGSSQMPGSSQVISPQPIPPNHRILSAQSQLQQYGSIPESSNAAAASRFQEDVTH